MRFTQVLHLIDTKYDTNDLGDSITIPTKRKVYADKKSVRQSEFYQAQATGLRPELTFKIWAHEYNNEPKLEYEGKTYTIIRTYETDHKTIELICQGVVNDGDA